MPALNYNYGNIDAGRIGALVDTEERDLISRVAEVDISIGTPLEPGDTTVQGSGSMQHGVEAAAVKPYAGGRFVGISVRERSIAADTNGDDKWTKGEHVRVIHSQGAIWVESGGAVAVGDPVFIAAGSTQFSNAGGTQISALFETAAAAAGELVIIRLQAMVV